MKILFVILLSVFCLNTYAESKLPAEVLIELEKSGGLPPPPPREGEPIPDKSDTSFKEYGDYKLQILKDGTVQKLYSEDAIIPIGVLAKDVIIKMSSLIDSIEKEKLAKLYPDQESCHDMPSRFVRVQKSDSTNILIWKEVSCIAYGGHGREISYLINSLAESVWFLKI
ncbi:MAG: hypothetical protein V4596_10290 [Bdellovibrionota bacterium]